MEGGEYGTGRGKGMVGHLQKALYGLRDSPHLWSRHLVKSLEKDVGVTVLCLPVPVEGTDTAWLHSRGRCPVRRRFRDPR